RFHYRVQHSHKKVNQFRNKTNNSSDIQSSNKTGSPREQSGLHSGIMVKKHNKQLSFASGTSVELNLVLKTGVISCLLVTTTATIIYTGLQILTL
ncbi:MAG TPA: hypothetical protein P5263_10285, partial [Methanoregulaceae archaeon]|nr:hypothetical protein [Methanoregulaceae archaeon]